MKKPSEDVKLFNKLEAMGAAHQLFNSLHRWAIDALPPLFDAAEHAPHADLRCIGAYYLDQRYPHLQIRW